MTAPMSPTHATRRPDPAYQELLDKQPYTTVLDGLTLEVHRNVFPPDLGRCAREMARLGGERRPASALDVGCGTGFIALSLKRAGVGEVWATDIHPAAVENTWCNVELNRHVGPVMVVRGDLLEAIPQTVRFDLVVFNQPFGPGREERRCGCGPDGGAAISRRFLSAAPAHLNPGGLVMMAFSDRQADEHDPRHAAAALGYAVTTLLDIESNGARNRIYAMWPGAGRS